MAKKRVEEQYSEYLRRIFPEEKGMPKTVTFQVTDACNLACTYCYQINKAHHVMPFDVAKTFIDKLLTGADGFDQYVDKDTPGVIIEFIGGEPFLEIDLISDITDYFIAKMIELHHPWAKRFRISICSNGVLYLDPKVQEYFRKHAQHLSFSISIDGNKELHDACRVFPDGTGSYDIAIKGVKHYQEKYGHMMGTKMTLSPYNIDHTYDALTNLIDLGYDNIHLNCVYEKGWTNEHAKILYDQLKRYTDDAIVNKWYEDIEVSMFSEFSFEPMDENDNQNWCGGNGAMLSIDWKGDMYPCIRYMESSLGDDVEPIIIGNVYTGMMKKDKEKKWVECLKCITRRSSSSDECWSCPIAKGCSWCTAYNYQEFGTPHSRATYICCMHKARALANAYYWNKVYRERNIPKRFKIHVPKDWALEIIGEDEWNMLKELESV